MITTDVAGCRTLVRNGVEGFLVPPEDCRATASALQALYDAPDLRIAMGIAARARFENGFREEDVERVTIALYKKLDMTG